MTSTAIRLVAATLALAATTATLGGIDRLAAHAVSQASVTTTVAHVPLQRIVIVGKRLPA